MTSDNSQDQTELKQLKIESPVPSTAVGIESIKESYPETMSPHRRIFKWFARRPTTTTRLALLASLLPPDISDNELLRLMCVGPKEEISGDIEDYVVHRDSTKDSRDGTIEEHFGYEYAHKRLPTKNELEEFHEMVEEHWDGDRPTVLDPTAGGGTIPFESARYGFPTISNELNPVAWLINKAVLEYARDVGSLDTEVRKWAQKVDNHAKRELSEYFPSRNGVNAEYYFRTYSIDCPSCGERYPLSNQWWFNRSGRKMEGYAVKPIYSDGDVDYEVVNLQGETDFDPSQGTVEGGDAECPHCGVVTERDDLVNIFQSGEFEFELCAIKFDEKIGGTKYHSPSEEEQAAIKNATKKVKNDLNLSTLLQQDRFLGYYDRAGPYGITQWRDLFTPRQLLTHASYLEGYQEVKPKIQKKYDEDKAEAILVLLTFIGSVQINHNSRLTPIHSQRGIVDDMFANNNFSFQWSFGENNLLSGGKSYESWTDNIVSHYEEVVEYYPDGYNDIETEVMQGDAGDLSVGDDSVQAIIIDPPYGDNIIYSEIADAFYVWQKKYLSDIFPDAYEDVDTNRTEEAVENPVLQTADSKPARERYEEKMEEIFSEAYRVLEPGGVITIYFTDKEIAAWDSLTTSIMQSDFTITATHTISSEHPSRIGVQGQSSADTSLLLTCRKPEKEQDNTQPTLWSDIRDNTRQAARKKALSMLNSDLALTKTDVIIGAFGPTLRVFTEEYPVVDKHENTVRPKQALEEARMAVTEVLIERELSDDLDDVDPLTRWYILSWLVYDRQNIPYDEARQLGLGVGVEIDEIKRDTKIWGKSRNNLILKGQSERVQDYDSLESGDKRRQRAYPIDPRESSFGYCIDAVHAALNVLETKGGDYTWNWITDRDYDNTPWFKRTVKSLIQVIPENHSDYDQLVNLASGATGEQLDIDIGFLDSEQDQTASETTLQDF